MAEDFVIEMLHITKEFPGIKANDDITLQLRKGEVHALLGENGAGKSTLMSVLFGLYQPEEGKILKNGKEVAIRNPNDANALGIGMVHQHFKLVECFSVLDNIILGVEPNKLGFLQKAEARKKVVALSEKYGLRVDPDALISDISVGMQQRVEILKMLYRDNEILIFDEPTAVLTPQEIDELMEIMRGFKKEGKSILFITHKLNEIMAVADRCTVLRKGKYMGTVDIKDTTKEELSRMMVGRDVQLQVDKKPAHPGDVVLDVEGVTIHNDQRKKDSVKDVTFQVHAGEIVCLAGIEGNGQTELVYGLTGLEKLSGGKITLDGQDITHLPPDQRKIGIVFQNYALFENMTVLKNVAYALRFHAAFRGKEAAMAKDILERVGMGDALDKYPAQLSGGQQQRTAIARTLVMKPDVILFDEPMAALDAENRLTLRDEIKKLQHSFDSTILYVTHDQEEAFALSDRIMVLEQGRIHQLDTPENLLHHPADSYVEQFVGQNLLRRLRDLQQYTNMAEEQ